MMAAAISFVLALISLLRNWGPIPPCLGLGFGIFSIFRVYRRGTPRMRYAAAVSTVINAAALAKVILDLRR